MDLSRMICPNCQGRLTHDQSQLWLKCSCGFQIYSKELITRDEILMGRDKDYPLTPEMEENLTKLTYAINMFRAIYGKPMKVTSGYRPKAFNEAAGGALHSNHMICLAVDISDPEGKLRAYILDHLEVAKTLGLYFEDFRWTPGWCHIQVISPKSGKRIYIPNSNPSTNPNSWRGEYDSKYDN